MKLLNRRAPRYLAMAIASTFVLGLAAAPAIAAEAPDPSPYSITVTSPDGNSVSLSSKPGALKTIWLVFQGGQVTGSPWNDNRDPAALNGSPINFGAVAGDSVALRTEVFQRISEFYSPFDVNTTTVRPAPELLSKDSSDDTKYGSIAIFTGQTLGTNGLTFFDANDADGIAHSGTFGDPTDSYAWVSNTEMVAGNAKQLADVGAHEIGHTLGLDHHGYGADVYYSPSQGLWAPIMGSAEDVAMARWSDGQYPNASNPDQDDLQVLTKASAAGTTPKYFMRTDGSPVSADTDRCTDNSGEEWLPVDAGICEMPEADRAYVDHHTYYTGRLEFIPDDHGNEAASAIALNAGVAKAGLIGRNDDVDVFSVVAASAGTLDLAATVAAFGPTLDIRMTVTNSAGTQIGDFNPDLGRTGASRQERVTGADASGTLHVAAGTYFVTIDGIGFGSIADALAKDTTKVAPEYGSLGRYNLAAAFTADVINNGGGDTGGGNNGGGTIGGGGNGGGTVTAAGSPSVELAVTGSVVPLSTPEELAATGTEIPLGSLSALAVVILLMGGGFIFAAWRRTQAL